MSVHLFTKWKNVIAFDHSNKEPKNYAIQRLLCHIGRE